MRSRLSASPDTPRSPIRDRGAVCFLVMLLAAGCLTAAPARDAHGPLFYPPLPNPPRIQYLASFSSAADVGKSRSVLAELLVGKDPKEREGVTKAYGVGLFAGKLYVVDTRGPGYVVFDLENKEFTPVPGSGPGRMRLPINIAIDADGTKYVTDVGRNQILVFDREDRFVRAYGTEGQFKPGDVAIVGGRLYVTDLKHHEIQVLDQATGNLVFKFGKVGAKEGDLFYPTNVAVGPDNHLYVTDTVNFRVQKFTLDGKFVRSYGTIGTRFGQFARPKGVAVDREGRFYVVDASFENVQLFDPDGRLLLFFGEPGGARENINLPTKVVIDYRNAGLFQKYADPKFKLEYVILVASQFGASKVNVFGFGKMEGMDYSAAEAPQQVKR